MQIKYILGIFFFTLIFVLGKMLCENLIPGNWKYCFAFIFGEIGFCIFKYFLNKKD